MWPQIGRKGKGVVEKTTRTLVTQWAQARRATQVQLGSLGPCSYYGNAACFMGHCRLPDTLGLVGGGPVVPIPAPMQATLLHPTPRAVVTTCHPSPCSPGGHDVLPNPGAVLATRRKRADTHQLHADDKGRPCGSEVQDWDPGLGPFLRGGKGRGLPRVAPCSPTSGLLTV